MAINRIERLLIDQNGNQQNGIAINRTKSYRKNRKAIDRTEKLSIEQKSYQQNRKAIHRTEKLSKEKLKHI